MRRLLYVNCTFYHLYTTIATTPRDGYCVSVTLGDSGDHDHSWMWSILMIVAISWLVSGYRAGNWALNFMNLEGPCLSPCAIRWLWFYAYWQFCVGWSLQGGDILKTKVLWQAGHWVWPHNLGMFPTHVSSTIAKNKMNLIISLGIYWSWSLRSGRYLMRSMSGKDLTLCW
jgi:hypothetical protein